MSRRLKKIAIWNRGLINRLREGRRKIVIKFSLGSFTALGTPTQMLSPTSMWRAWSNTDNIITVEKKRINEMPFGINWRVYIDFIIDISRPGSFDVWHTISASNIQTYFSKRANDRELMCS